MEGIPYWERRMERKRPVGPPPTITTGVWVIVLVVDIELLFVSCVVDVGGCGLEAMAVVRYHWIPSDERGRRRRRRSFSRSRWNGLPLFLLIDETHGVALFLTVLQPV